jgi:twitching motility protein PilT
VLTDSQKKRFEESLELDFSFGIKGLARFRCNMFNQRGAGRRCLPADSRKIRSFQELGLPPVLQRWPNGRAVWCSSPVRPAAASRRRSPR